VVFLNQEEEAMKNLIVAIAFTFLLMPMEKSFWVIHLLVDIPDEEYAMMDETHQAVEKDNEEQIKKLENRLLPVLSRIHKDRIEREWSESLY
jgi:hypothetical protein